MHIRTNNYEHIYSGSAKYLRALIITCLCFTEKNTKIIQFVLDNQLIERVRLDRSTALYIYKAKNCKLLALFTHAQKSKFLFK
jgi:hypothetical protein